MALVFKIQKKVIESVIKRGKNINFPLFGVKYEKNDTKTTSFVFVISKKEEKKSHERNKTRRRIREAFREVFKKSDFGINGVVFCKKDLKNKGFLEIVAMAEALKKELGFDK